MWGQALETRDGRWLVLRSSIFEPGKGNIAMDWLERAYEERAGGVYGIKGSFLFSSLREHPRFKALLRKMNLANA
jgi:hypothetical protein